MTEKHLVIATRESQLALWQAQYIQQRLMTLFPELSVTLLGLTTKGDQILDRSLSKIGGKGLFVKELEVALADGRADLAVHSMKDVPMQLPEGFALAAICEREDPTDAFVSNHYAQLADLPAGAIVGTSSLRREAQVRRHYPHLQIKPLRGNLQTRLGKLDKGEFDAIILASAGLKRLGLAERIRMPLALNDSLPSPGQGALGIEIASHRSDLLPYLTALNHAETRACVEAERTLSRILGGSCQVPIAGFAQIEHGQLSLKGLVASVDGVNMVQAQAQGRPDQAAAIGQQVAAALIEQGAQGLIDQALSQAKAE